VRINREKAEQSSDAVKEGDVLTITLDRRILVYRVLALGERRGPAVEARHLYEDLSPETATHHEKAPASG
jgi:ribosome-associated heat shock protein Hsp15